MKIAGELLTVIMVMAIVGMLRLVGLPFRTVARLLPARAA
ncbi:hypothetical protein QO017_005541 [Methylobacterium gregans]|nr:hypothetical protein [Methylobacterium gregans]